MQRYLLTLQYDGKDFHGWQIQPNGMTVEEELEKSLSTLLRHDVNVVGAGRTDASVHAKKMTCHFDEEEAIGDLPQLMYKLNRLLPASICVMDIQPVPDSLHARFSAKQRTYHYYIHTRKDAFLNRYSCLISYALDFEKMNKAAQILTEHQDFGAFCKTGSDVKTTLCTVTEARWVKTDENRYYFTITANRFLRNMVRAVVGTLIEVGRGRITLPDFQKIIETGTRSDAGESMPADALFLEDVKY
ncbi:MAG: tRNA pseudouridine(38-40) synthase TruA [Prevotella sp.]|nr:tRNA pseudouridine(38-40) synthase TruA [Candidatus Equicola faecalis]